MDAAGVRRERVFVLPDAAVAPAEAVRAAVAAGDARAVDAALWPVVEALPLVREGTDVWPALAAWLRAHDGGELADKWDARGRAVEGAWYNDDRRARAAVGRIAPFTAGVWLALPLVGLVLGLGAGAARRKQGPPGPWVLPAVSTAALVFLGAMLSGALGGQLSVIEQHAKAPRALLEDRLGDGTVEAWARERVRPLARDKIVERAREEAAAQAHGAHATPPTDEELRAALGPREGLMARVGDAAGGQRVHALLPDGAVAAVVAQADNLARSLAHALVLFALGLAVGLRAPRAWRVAHAAVPGSSRWLIGIGPVALALAIAAVIALSTGGRAAGAPLDTRAVWGLEGVPLLPAPAPDTTWAWWLLGAALATHALGVWLDARTRR
jgi:hypothetical protein